MAENEVVTAENVEETSSKGKKSSQKPRQDRRDRAPRRENIDIEKKVVSVRRVQKVVKGGRILRFSALVVVGDGKGKVGLGIGKSREVLFGSTSTCDDESIGLLGFTSARSLTYCLNFAEIYMDTYGDSDWVRIIGDTLGMSNKRKEIPMRTVIKNNLDSFKKADPVEDLDLSVAEMCKKIMDNGSIATDEEVMKLENLIKNINPKDITSEDVVNMSRLTANVFEDQRYANIINIFSNKMHSSEASY